MFYSHLRGGVCLEGKEYCPVLGEVHTEGLAEGDEEIGTSSDPPSLGSNICQFLQQLWGHFIIISLMLDCCVILYLVSVRQTGELPPVRFEILCAALTESIEGPWRQRTFNIPTLRREYAPHNNTTSSSQH